MGEVPVLEHDGQRLSQSGVILDYLADSLGKFGPADDAERREILRWLLWDNHKLTSYTATYRFLRAFTKNTDPAVLDPRLWFTNLGTEPCVVDAPSVPPLFSTADAAGAGHSTAVFLEPAP